METGDEEWDEKMWVGGMEGKSQLDCDIIKVKYKI